MRVLFVLEQPEILQALQQPEGVNPGFGGTSFTTVRLVLALAQDQAGTTSTLELRIGASNPPVANFHGIPVVDLANATDQHWDVAVATGGSLDALHSGQLRLRSTRLLAWIRHPYDWDKTRKAKALKAELVSVGKAQYLSNALIAGWHHHIDNLFCAERIRHAAGWANDHPAPPLQRRQLRIGFMGALVPSKGFHQVAQHWPAIAASLRQLGVEPQLEVIGGASLYHFGEGHPRLPCAQDYGDSLERWLGAELGRSVRFHGTLGPERYSLMASCDLAVVNPSGQGEAFPATILEWLALAVPVISSQRYGCGDAMRYLPELSIGRSGQIQQRIQDYLLQPGDQQHIQREHCRRVAELFSAQQPLIVSQWRLLLQQPTSRVKVNEYLNGKIYRLLLREWLVMSLQSLRQRLRPRG
jgi:glycosyltransferase involved in cell wall biosynthesis